MHQQVEQRFNKKKAEHVFLEEEKTRAFKPSPCSAGDHFSV